jgi:hypothetical protein
MCFIFRHYMCVATELLITMWDIYKFIDLLHYGMPQPDCVLFEHSESDYIKLA